MLVKNIMSEPVICCTPWDSVRYAAAPIAFHSVGALPVVSDLNDPLLEGIVTDRDLCSRFWRWKIARGIRESLM